MGSGVNRGERGEERRGDEMSRVEFMLMMIYVKYIKLEYFVIYLKIKKKNVTA